jgi:hypothetical protein
VIKLIQERNEQSRIISIVKKKTHGGGLNASSRDFSWLDRTTSVCNISCAEVCLLRVAEDWEWLKLKEKSVLVCAANFNLFDGNIHENVTERKNAGTH